MKVIAYNGSPRKKGNTSILIQTVLKELNKQGIETEEIHIGLKNYRGCLGCMKCAENKNGKCVITTDDLNLQIEKIIAADAVILGSPIYCANISGQMKTFIDRVSMVGCVNGDLYKRKPGASVLAVRRAGGVEGMNTINSFFAISQMLIVGTTYWNMGYGMLEGEVLSDAEGIQTMVNLGKNMGWLLKSLELAKGKVEEPDSARQILTNFIR
ncbi:MAG TPA: flavodoxin family protein [Lentisphaeria bacterium]|nr:MAG: FMN reductase [Lentisphaerae bacterium GWF2_38_69]HBM17112.1 flavodoxin family protein [Lentisphaeria bacterium]